MAEVALKSVRKAYGKIETIHGVDLHIRDGEFVVLVGPSGCGKSTLLRIVAGLEEATGGDVTIGGERVNDRAPSERGIAMVFQSYALYPHMTVRENIAFGLSMKKMPAAEIEQRVQQAADRLELSALMDRLPKQLSGGQRQRVAIGRAIVRDPQVFLFDEPLSNLDAALRVQMRLEIADLHRQLGVTTIYVTHDQVEAMTLADKIVVLRLGVIEQIGTPLELYHRPGNLFVAGFIGSPKMNFVPADVTEAGPEGVRLNLPGGVSVLADVDGSGLRPGDRVTFGIRPEHLTYGEELPTNRPEAVAMVPVVVEAIEELGEHHYLYVRLFDRTLVTVRGSGVLRARIGDRLDIPFLGEHGHVFGADERAKPRLSAIETVSAQRSQSSQRSATRP
jgi:multiple sugar transport system ATP-binding protein